MVDQEISQHRAAEGSDERCHHRVSQGRAPLSQNRMCERFWTLPITRFYRLVLLRPHRFPPIRRPNHASRFEGILKMKLQAFRASDPETLQSQLDQTARKRLSVSGLEVFHGRLTDKTFEVFPDCSIMLGLCWCVFNVCGN